MGGYEHIFKPMKIGNITVKNRIEFAPVSPMLATIDCGAGRELIEWVRTIAKGGAGIVTIGNTNVYSESSLRTGHVLTLGFDKSMNVLNRIAEVIQGYGAKASIELNFNETYKQYTHTGMTIQEIKTMVDMFARAAWRCMNAGMDMIMVHGAHGHFISQFPSPNKNLRSDDYGGSFKNRARLVNEILAAIREQVGNRLAIEYRISGDELVPEGLHFEEQLEFVKLIENKIDLLHVSAGKLKEDSTLPWIIQPTYVPRGVNIYLAEQFKRELNINVAAVGSLDLAMAEQIIAEGKADMVAMARSIIADPDCIKKIKQGEEKRVRPCIRCNTCIERTHVYHLALRCAVNPTTGREAEHVTQPAPTNKKKVVVIGGGPAGMEGARRAAERGHEVILFEKSAQLGGALTVASAAPFKEDMKKYLGWTIQNTMNTPKLTVKLSTEATPEMIQSENPDALIIAVGSAPVIPKILGVYRDNVIWVGNVMLGQSRVGNRVLVAGAGLAGSEAALFLAQQGKKVTLIDMLPLHQIDNDAPLINIISLRSKLKELNVRIKTEVALEAITDTGAVIIDKNWVKTEIPCDTVVLSLGFEPRQAVVEMFQGLAPEVYVIGDCNNQRGNLWNATREGYFAGMEI